MEFINVPNELKPYFTLLVRKATENFMGGREKLYFSVVRSKTSFFSGSYVSVPLDNIPSKNFIVEGQKNGLYVIKYNTREWSESIGEDILQTFVITYNMNRHIDSHISVEKVKKSKICVEIGKDERPFVGYEYPLIRFDLSKSTFSRYLYKKRMFSKNLESTIDFQRSYRSLYKQIVDNAVILIYMEGWGDII